jgi:hypothetical protein
MRFSSILGILLVAWTGESVCSEAQYTLPVSKAKGADGFPLYVDDSAIASIIPELRNAGVRRTTCANSMMIPPRLWITYEPKVTGPHEGTVTSLECGFKDNDSMRALTGELMCNASSAGGKVFFDDDPTRFYSIDDGKDSAEAMELFRAFFKGQLDFVDKSQAPDLGKIRDVSMTQEGKNRFTIRWGDCGCTFSLKAARDKNGKWHASDAQGICI